MTAGGAVDTKRLKDRGSGEVTLSLETGSVFQNGVLSTFKTQLLIKLDKGDFGLIWSCLLQEKAW